MIDSTDKEQEKKEQAALLAQLTEAFGKYKAKDLVKQVKKIKKDHPNDYFSFIFEEDGTIRAIKK